MTGIGGIFFKAENPESLYEWHEKYLRINQDVPGQGVPFRWKEEGDQDGFTAWSIFKSDTNYFEPSAKPFMLNFWVENLDGRIVGDSAVRGCMDRSQAGGLRLRPLRLDHGPGRQPD